MTAPPEHGKENERSSGEPLRAAINSGRTKDKVAGSDPAASPLGTDDEAGGFPLTRQQTDAAMRQEVGDRAGDDAAGKDGNGSERTGTWIAVAIGALVIVLVLLLIVL